MDARKIGQLVPTDLKYWTTWSWWIIIGVSILHVAHATPSYIAGGFFAVALVVVLVGSAMFVMCNRSHLCTTRFYMHYSAQKNLSQTDEQDLDVAAIASWENLGTHVLPALIVTAALIYRPSRSTYWQRVLVAAIPVTLYNLHSYFVGPSINATYGFGNHMYLFPYVVLLLLALVKV